MEETTVELTVDEQILSELEDISGKMDDILVILEEMQPDAELSDGDTATETSAETYQDFVMSSTTAGLTVSVCSLGVQLVILGAFLARILFRKM